MNLGEVLAYYDELAAKNPVLAARFALDHGLFMSPRKVRSRSSGGGSGAVIDNRDGKQRLAAMRGEAPTVETIAERLAWARNGDA